MTTSELWDELRAAVPPVLGGYRRALSRLPVRTKPDRTLLTDADLEIQELLVSAIRRRDPRAVIIAEEDERTETRADVLGADGRVWVVDPIDGTAEFVRPDGVEFCTVVCLLERWRPAAAFVLAPELGRDETPLVARLASPDEPILVNGRAVEPPPAETRFLSMTRSGGVPRPTDARARRAGYELKTATTSQSLDMLRTAADLTELTAQRPGGFGLFWRRDQKVWDGAAGLAFAAAAGLWIGDEGGRTLELDAKALSAPTPILPSTVVGAAGTARWFLEAVGE